MAVAGEVVVVVAMAVVSKNLLCWWMCVLAMESVRFSYQKKVSQEI